MKFLHAWFALDQIFFKLVFKDEIGIVITHTSFFFI